MVSWSSSRNTRRNGGDPTLGRPTRALWAVAFVALWVASVSSAQSPSVEMGFFVTSVGNGALGANYGGLVGADARCQSLAAAVGSGGRIWRAYLARHRSPFSQAASLSLSLP